MSADKPTASSELYLWLSCEGWVRFGPFRHLRWRRDAERGSLRITGPMGEVIAYEDPSQDCWRATHPDYQGAGGSGWAFRDPMVTSSPKHPHPRRF